MSNATNPELLKLRDIIEGADYDVEDYAGRGMYGTRCMAFSTEDDTGKAFAKLIESAQECESLPVLVKALGSMRDDSAGRGTVFYFQAFKVPS